MKNILLLVHDDAGQEARLQAALDATRALDGHLECLDIAQIPVLFDDLNSTSAAMMLMDDEVDREKANRQRLEARLAGEGVAWSWTDAVGDIAEIVVERSAMADLVVLNRQIVDGLPDMRGITGAIVTGANKPVLAVADDLRTFNPFGRALIAWDDTDAARSTMQAAIPLLKLASAVELLHVAERGKEAELAAAALYLSRHGIHAEVKQAFDDEHSVAEVIAGEVTRWGADWLVMGAYDHSRLREALFGGTTRQILTNCSVPVILAH
jgi:nucleotide-binding universal stress UspA family protein